MSLREKLLNVKEQMNQLPVEVQRKFSASLQSLIDSDPVSEVLKAGEKAPMAVLTDADGHDVDLSRLLEQGPLVLVFYRGLWCPFCNVALAEYQQIVNDLAASGATLVAVSAQTPQSSRKTREALGITYRLLSDPDSKLASQYGVAFTLEAELEAVYQSLGADLRLFNGTDTLTLPMASVFVINPDGSIREVFVNVDYSERAAPEVLMTSVGA